MLFFIKMLLTVIGDRFVTVIFSLSHTCFLKFSVLIANMENIDSYNPFKQEFFIVLNNFLEV